MFGTLRLILASVVIFYHMGWHPFKMWIGSSAVIVFYMISGYAMSGLYHKRFIFTKNALAFYAERFVRIAPQYYLYLIFTIFMLYIPGGFFGIPPRELNIYNFLCNLLLLPMGIPHLGDIFPCFPLIPATFSLASECVFYLFVPFVFVHRKITLIALFLAIIVFCISSQAPLPTTYTYYFLPGILVYFLAGHFLYTRQHKMLLFLTIVLSLNLFYLVQAHLVSSGLNREVYLGIYAGLILILLLRDFKPNSIDNFLGSISYGAFLIHMPLMNYALASSSLKLFFISVLLGTLSYVLIEKPCRALYKKKMKRCRSSDDKKLESGAMAIS